MNVNRFNSYFISFKSSKDVSSSENSTLVANSYKKQFQDNYKLYALPSTSILIRLTEKISGKKFTDYPQLLKDFCYSPEMPRKNGRRGTFSHVESLLGAISLPVIAAPLFFVGYKLFGLISKKPFC